ncbi:hypothetical protein PMAYCL1PPCAC_14373, partial [Pristionchus mayeri]
LLLLSSPPPFPFLSPPTRQSLPLSLSPRMFKLISLLALTATVLAVTTDNSTTTLAVAIAAQTTAAINEFEVSDVVPAIPEIEKMKLEKNLPTFPPIRMPVENADNKSTTTEDDGDYDFTHFPSIDFDALPTDGKTVKPASEGSTQAAVIVPEKTVNQTNGKSTSQPLANNSTTGATATNSTANPADSAGLKEKEGGNNSSASLALSAAILAILGAAF